MQVVVQQITAPAEGLRSFKLVAHNGASLDRFTPGAHIDVAMPNGITRQYSLINQQGEDHYHICVNLDAASRGGSAFMHQTVAVGDTLEISAPKNLFPLVEDAPQTILIAGGIGITPIYAMVRRLAELKQPWRLYHCTRNVARTPFITELRDLAARSGGELVHVHDGIPGIRPLDVAEVVASSDPGTHFYCCGPTPLMNAFAQATAKLPQDRVHTEHFSNIVEVKADDAAFDVILNRSGRKITVPKGISILQALEAEGLAVLCSCREGICGTCETTILAGEPDHRDKVLTPDERATNETMMICVSRAKSAELTLDI
ncbi:PDR/VanB family oxidoreductase [Pararhodobacter sp.]|uniref:PDR/VanB family oxidoreductase n=1 Tax=Pararhodobacter sp. TaxID=2127056 RepID=UPI002AFF98B5|nr:PDR/VanB family oxidoreductase [Pararhodobacter sp.]